MLISRIIEYIVNADDETQIAELTHLIKKAYKDDNKLSEAYSDIINNEGSK